MVSALNPVPYVKPVNLVPSSFNCITLFADIPLYEVYSPLTINFPFDNISISVISGSTPPVNPLTLEKHISVVHSIT